jgi:hypothetical protein
MPWVRNPGYLFVEGTFFSFFSPGIAEKKDFLSGVPFFYELS